VDTTIPKPRRRRTQILTAKEGTGGVQPTKLNPRLAAPMPAPAMATAVKRTNGSS
jgi:hypothetical protein